MEDGQEVYTCASREDPDNPVGFYDFLPVFVGDLTEDASYIRYDGKCFGDAKMSLAKMSDSQYKVVFDLGSPKSVTCSETFLLGNTEVLHFDAFFTRGSHEMTFDFSS